MLVTYVQAKGNEAANTGGAQAALNAATAADVNELLDSILPPTVASYVELVTAHLNAGIRDKLAFITRPCTRFISLHIKLHSVAYTYFKYFAGLAILPQAMK